MLVLLPATGCGSASDGVAVHGRVTYRDQPLSNASLTFFPSQGRAITAPLVDGQFTVELPPGDYQMVVTVGAEIPPGYKEGDPLPPPKIVLPDEYTIRAKTELKAQIASGRSEPLDLALQ